MPFYTFKKGRYDKRANASTLKDIGLESSKQGRVILPKGPATSSRTMRLRASGSELLVMLNYEPMESFNDMKVKYNSCEPTGEAGIEKSNASSLRLAVITNFFYVNPASYNLTSLEIGNGKKVDNWTMHSRNMEIINTLASNLKHPYIDEIHILVQDMEAGDYLRRMPLGNSRKIVIQVMNHAVEMKMQLEYAGRCLKDRIVAIAHQDNFFGDGWGNITSSVLTKRRLMYALTRHSSHRPCKASKHSFNCDPGSTYVGSHDVFVFHVKDSFTPDMLKPLDNVTPNLNGMENVLIWMFEKKFKYTVLNPCPILIVHHQHCIAIRGKGRKRINTRETTGMVPFTNKLE